MKMGQLRGVGGMIRLRTKISFDEVSTLNAFLINEQHSPEQFRMNAIVSYITDLVFSTHIYPQDPRDRAK